MTTCPHCGAMVSDEGSCGNCQATTASVAKLISASQPQSTAHASQPDASISDDVSLRLEKAMKRTELLGYAAAGLAVAILAVLIGIAFL